MRNIKHLKKYEYTPKYPITKDDRRSMITMVSSGTDRESFIDYWRENRGLTIANANYYYDKAKKGWLDLPIDSAV